jgi:hypothetical protein
LPLIPLQTCVNQAQAKAVIGGLNADEEVRLLAPCDVHYDLFLGLCTSKTV